MGDVSTPPSTSATPATPGFHVKPPITGHLVHLEPADAGHVGALLPLLADSEVARLTGSVHTSTPTAAELVPWSAAELEEIYARWARAADRVVWVVRDRATGAIVGEAVLNDLDLGNASCGFRMWLAEAGRGRGLGSETVALVLRHAFGVAHLHRVSLEVYAFNPRARHVYEKAGFRLEGTLRDALRFDDGWVDCHVLGITADDWAARHQDR